MTVSIKQIHKWGKKKKIDKLIDCIYQSYDHDIRNALKHAFLGIGVESIQPIINHFDENYGEAFIQASCLNILAVFSNPKIIELAIMAVSLRSKEVRREALNLFFYNEKDSLRFFKDTLKTDKVTNKFKTQCLKALHVIYKDKDCKKTLSKKILDLFDLASEHAEDPVKKELYKILKTIKTDKSRAIITYLENS